MRNFRDWLNAQESSPFTRTRRAAALGLGPDIPDASINSRSTAAPWMIEKLVSKNKKSKKKIEEAKKVVKTPSYQLDDLYRQALKDKDDFGEFIKKTAEDEKGKAEKDKSEEEKEAKTKAEKDKEEDKENDKKDSKWKPKDSGSNGSSSDGSEPSTSTSQSNTHSVSQKMNTTRSEDG